MTKNHELEQFIEQSAKANATYAVAYALLRLAEAQADTAVHLKYLGVGDAGTTMGAVEYLAVELSSKLEKLADAADKIAEHYTQSEHQRE